MGGISVLAAIIVGLVSSFVQSLGLTIQRKSHVQDDAKPLDQRRKPLRRPLWLLGFGIFISSNIFGTVFQIGALPIVILAPLGAISLLWNALLARILLGDRFTPITFLGTSLVASGAVLIAVFGVVPESNHSLDDLLPLFNRPAFVAFFTIVTVATFGVLILAHIVSFSISRQLRSSIIALPGDSTPPTSSLPPSNYGSPQEPSPIPFRPTIHSRRWTSPASPVTSRLELPEDHKPGVRFAVDPTSSPTDLSVDMLPAVVVPQPNAAQQKTLTLTGLAFAAASGVLSGMSLVLAKAAVELLIITLEHFRTGKGENQFVKVQSWLLLAGMAVGGVLQFVYLNYSLTFASPALICPFAFCFFNLASIFDGLVFYDQFGRLAPYQIALVSIGVALLLLGVWVVSAIQPTGQGGVEVGTWVEDDLECEGLEANDELEAGEGATLLGGESFAESESDINQQTDQRRVRTFVYPQPRSPHPLDLSITSDSDIGGGPLSPSLSLMSPTTRARYRYRPRFGSLIPELTQHGAPTGFSIGLGAASPGFVLRSGSISQSGDHSTYRRGRSRSEGPQGIEAIMRGDQGTDGGGRSERRAAPPRPLILDPRLTRSGMADHEGRMEDVLRGWVEESTPKPWWRRLFGGSQTGKIKLQEDGS